MKFFMHIFNMSVVYLHSFNFFDEKLSRELITQTMHYKNTDPLASIFLQHATYAWYDDTGLV